MACLGLVDSHRGELEFEGDVMVVVKTDEDSGARRRVRWTLELLSETSMSQILVARNKRRPPKIVKRVADSKLSKNELGALVWLNAVSIRVRRCRPC